jgi:hypothetical protein
MDRRRLRLKEAHESLRLVIMESSSDDEERLCPPAMELSTPALTPYPSLPTVRSTHCILHLYDNVLIDWEAAMEP